MELVKEIIPLLLTLSLGLLIVSVGLSSSRGDLVYVLSRPRLLLRAILAIDILPVIAAVVVIGLFPGIPTPAKVAILFMAISPVPPLVPGKAIKFGGRKEYVYGLQVAMTLLAIVSVPLLGSLVSHIYEADAQFPIALVARNVLIGMVIPLAIGVIFGRWLAPAHAQRAARIVSTIATILLVVAFVPIIVSFWPAMIALIGDGTVLAMAIVIAIAIAGGHFLGDPGDRSSLAFGASMRHPGIALALASANHSDPKASAGILLFLLTGIVLLIPYQKMTQRRHQARDAQDAQQI